MDDAELAASLVRDAGRLAERMRRAGIEVERKTSVSDVVTSADRAAEELIAKRLRDERPDDGLVGEEGSSRPGTRTWFVDPVDGTYNFSSGLPFWCSAVALAEGDQPIVGAVYEPVAGELWLGGPDHPTTRNDDPLPPIADRPLAEVSLSTYLHPATLPDDGTRLPLLRAMRGAATVRMLGSGSAELAAVAAGRLGAWLHHSTQPWDWLPGAALIRGAGGATVVLDAHGHRWYVAGCARVVDELIALLHA